MRKQSSDLSAWLGITAVGFAVSVSSGCGYLMQARDHAQPTAVLAMREAQTLNPDAGKNRKVVAGMDGVAGKNTSDSFARSFIADDARVDANAEFQGLEGLGQN